MLIYGRLYGILARTVYPVIPQLIKRPLDCLPPGGILKTVNSLYSKRRYEEWSVTILSWPDLFEKAYPPSCLRLTKNLKNIVPRADKIDTDKHIGRVQVPLLLRLRPFIVIDIKLRIYQFDMIVTL